jgi:hypothetical protein
MLNEFKKHLNIKDMKIEELELKLKSENSAKENYQIKNK